MTHFANRHIGPDDADISRMLETVGHDSLESLLDTAVPDSIRTTEPLSIDQVVRGAGTGDEGAVLERLAEFADENVVTTSLIGCGWYGTLTPPVILRNLIENPAWYTAYTPYQPEISQGRLEMLLNFQTLVADLCGIDIANSSMLDEATAAAEAMTLARRRSRVDGRRFLVDADCHPQVIDVVRGRATPLGIDVETIDLDSIPADNMATDFPGDVFGILLAHPGSSGAVRDHRGLADRAHAGGAVVCVTTDLLALTILEPPGEWGADVVVGSAQRLGVPMGYGGPHAGFMAVSEDARRALPGRLVGVSVDTEGRSALRLALQTREQHIRREKATSNICTAQVLLANVTAAYAVYHGPAGLTGIAERVHALTTELSRRLTADGTEVVNGTFFDTLTLRAPSAADQVIAAGASEGITMRRVDDDHVGVSLDETSDDATVEAVARAFAAVPVAGGAAAPTAAATGIPHQQRRTSEFLTHPTFHAHRSETELMRYLRRLADADLALDRTMIPLGSCTMKLNAAVEMIPITWPGFADIHPFAPPEHAVGYARMIAELEAALCRLTGYDAVSLQPNAGSQGELAGLLAISAYHASRSEPDRDVCLIPASAHGTNAASAVMAGMRVVVVATDDSGNVDMADLEAKAAEHSEDLAAAMVTYPSTHGVFEEGIGELCRIIHEHGGQVYVDGANLNALVGVARPGWFGADVSHLNLHKTFCIPHGGGGPGVGPVAARAHLAPFLPGHRYSPVPEERDLETRPTISAAPFGSAGILPISWAYVALMGDRMADATAVAILSANYLAARLGEHFPVLYTGSGGLVAHECILDLRPITKETGISAEDVAKRLIDHGFHAPTLSFPVAGTLMVEPTESESLDELDRFVDAMVAIRAEIASVADGTWPTDDNPLVNAPHTAEAVTAEDWKHAYSRTEAAWPLGNNKQGNNKQGPAKYWAPVSRIDGSWGDRNLMCSCPSPEEFAD